MWFASIYLLFLHEACGAYTVPQVPQVVPKFLVTGQVTAKGKPIAAAPLFLIEIDSGD